MSTNELEVTDPKATTATDSHLSGEVKKPGGGLVHWQAIEPVADEYRTIGQLRAKGYQCLGVIGDRSHLERSGSHTPWSTEGYGGIPPKPGFVYAIDVHAPDLRGLETWLVARLRAGKYTWVSYFNVNGHQYSRRDGFRTRRASADRHLHLAGRPGFEAANSSILRDWEARRTHPAARPASYSVQGNRWNKSVLTYHFENYEAKGMNRAQVRAAVRAAFDEWQRVTPVRFVEAENGDADIRIGFYAHSHGDGRGNAFDGPGHVLAHCFFPAAKGSHDPLAGDCHFDASEQWSVDGAGGYDLQTVALHEFGHALGLEHSDKADAVMFATYSGVRRRLSVDDVHGITAIYRRAAASTAPVPQLGVQLHALWDGYWPDGNPSDQLRQHIAGLAAHHVEVVRIDFGWSASQPRPAAPDANYYYNRRLAAVIDLVKAHDMQILLTVHQSPAWARPGTGCAVAQYPADPRSLRSWLAWVVRTFGADLIGVEIWNEPNLFEFTGIRDPRRQVARYVPLLRTAYEAVKSVSDLQVVLGGPSKVDDDFLRGCYEAGAREYFDVMAVHPYQGDQTVDPFDIKLGTKERITHLPAVLDLMAEYHDGDKPIMATELGFSVHPNKRTMKPSELGVSDDEQAATYLTHAFEVAARNRVQLAVVYCAYRDTGDPHDRGYSILEADGTAKAQLIALADLAARREG